MCEFYGIRGPGLTWILNKKATVCSDYSKRSPSFPITCGVPQVSVLEPLLSLIFVNDLSQSMSNIKNNFNELFHDPQEVIVPMFADNTSHVCLARTEKGLLELSR